MNRKIALVLASILILASCSTIPAVPPSIDSSNKMTVSPLDIINNKYELIGKGISESTIILFFYDKKYDRIIAVSCYETNMHYMYVENGKLLYYIYNSTTNECTLYDKLPSQAADNIKRNLGKILKIYKDKTVNKKEGI